MNKHDESMDLKRSMIFYYFSKCSNFKSLNSKRMRIQKVSKDSEIKHGMECD